ncbi:MAG TPA: TMEM175 family protein [Streptosporangiaceae bacterium]
MITAAGQGDNPDAAGSGTDDATTLTTGRVEAFSDGVIAVAATLLVLEIKSPVGANDVWHFLGATRFSRETTTAPRPCCTR